MTKIPTAEEYCRKHQNSNHPDMISKLMKEFAQLHVEAALKACLDKFHHASKNNYDFGSSQIMNSYPESNIK